MDTIEARTHLIQLQAERALALSTPLGEVASYMADIDEEIDAWRDLYVATAVTEIATLRAELFGAQLG